MGIAVLHFFLSSLLLTAAAEELLLHPARPRAFLAPGNELLAFHRFPSPFASTPRRSLSTLQPSMVWEPTYPISVIYSQGSVYAAAASEDLPNVLLKLGTSGEMQANVTLDVPSDFWAQNLVAASSSIFALWIDTRDPEKFYVFQFDAISLTQLNVLPMPDQVKLLGVDAAGTTLLTSVLDSAQVVTLDAKTGKQTGAYTGGLTGLQVIGGALHPTNGSMLLVDGSSSRIILIKADNTVAYTIPLPSSLHEFGAVVVDAAGAFAYATLLTVQGSSPYVTTIQYDLSNGTQVARADLPYSPTDEQSRFISAAATAGELYFTNWFNGSINLQHLQDNVITSSFALSSHPVLSFPTGLAVLPAPDSSSAFVIVANNYLPQGFFVLDAATGAQVGRAVDVELAATGCQLVPWQDVAVSARGEIYLPICNGSVAVYRQPPSGQAEWVRTVELGSGTLPRAVAVDDRNSWLYLVDNNNSTQVIKYDLQSGEVVAALQGATDASFWDVEVDARDGGSVWATDMKGSSIYHWAGNGSLLSQWRRGGDGLVHLPFDLSLNPHSHQVVVTEEMTTGDGEPLRPHLLWLDMHTGVLLHNFTFALPVDATGVAASTDGRTVYALDAATNSIFLFDNEAHTAKQGEGAENRETNYRVATMD